LVRLLADEVYFEGYQAIWLVALASMSLGLSELGRIGCLVTNRTRLIARNQIVGAGANLILNLILVPEFGFMGAALSAAISFSLLAGLQAITSARFLTWRWPFRSILRVLAASAAMAGVVLLLQAGLPSNTTVWQAISLMLSIVIGGLIYGSVLWATGEITPQQLFNLFQGDRRQVAANLATPEMGQK
jgi:O-antigen/teichoic acid export membrane protein